MAFRRLRGPIALFAAAALLVGCRTIDLAQLMLQERQYAEDRLIAAEIRGELAAAPGLDAAQIEVDVFLKHVTLSGRADPSQAARAVAIAEAVPLVAGVDDRTQRLEPMAVADE
jgi:osmotically-inducible protein OsmY